jgi:signal transduction histidine kinase
VALAAASIAAALELAGWSEPWELPVRDAIVRAAPRAPSGRLVVVAIDEPSLEAFGPWPWPRERLATLAARVRGAGARAVAFDIVLAGRSAGDELLAKELSGGASILATALRPDGRWLLPSAPLAASSRLAHAHLERDADGVLRRIAGTKQAEGRSIVALSAAVAAAMREGVAVPVGGRFLPSFRITPASIPELSAGDLLASRPLSMPLDGRVVLIGMTAAGLVDQVPSPATPRGRLDPGVRIHGAAAEAISSGDLLRSLPPIGSAFLAALLAWGSLGAGTLGGRRRIAAGVGLVLLPLVAAPLLLLAAGLAIPAISLAMAAGVPFVATLVRTELAVFRSSEQALERLGRSGVQAGTGPSSPPRTSEARVRRLSELSAELDRLRRDEGEIRRTMAHELKTPLGSIRGLSQLLAGFDLDPAEARRVAELVGRETGRLARMIDELLALERIALRDFEAEGLVIDLTRLVAGRIDPVIRAGTTPIRFEAPTPVPVRGDRATLERVVDNLLGNALKFSPPGSPIVVRARIAAGDEAVLEVEDRGPGIPEAEREAIFQRFRRGAGAERAEGLGLGLALVAEAAAWHRGAIEVEPALPTGSLFRFRLPLASGATPAKGGSA